VYLFGLAAVVLLFAAVSATGNLLFTALRSCATVRAVLSGVYEVDGARGVGRVAGALGVALAALANYGGLALLLEDLRQTNVLPLFRRGEARASLEGELEQQLRRLEREPGVRQRL
jgi:succinate-acetate transporter protein